VLSVKGKTQKVNVLLDAPAAGRISHTRTMCWLFAGFEAAGAWLNRCWRRHFCWDAVYYKRKLSDFEAGTSTMDRPPINPKPVVEPGADELEHGELTTTPCVCGFDNRRFLRNWASWHCRLGHSSNC
jgi:hypothetical protein